MLFFGLVEVCLEIRYMEPVHYYISAPHIMGIHRIDSSSTMLNVKIHRQLTKLVGSTKV